MPEGGVKSNGMSEEADAADKLLERVAEVPEIVACVEPPKRKPYAISAIPAINRNAHDLFTRDSSISIRGFHLVTIMREMTHMDCLKQAEITGVVLEASLFPAEKEVKNGNTIRFSAQSSASYSPSAWRRNSSSQ